MRFIIIIIIITSVKVNIKLKILCYNIHTDITCT